MMVTTDHCEIHFTLYVFLCISHSEHERDISLGRKMMYIPMDMIKHEWAIIKIHTLFCYYAFKRQISTKLIGKNMFCLKANQLSIVLPSKSRLVQLRIYTCYRKTCFFLGALLFFQKYLLLVNCTIQM